MCKWTIVSIMDCALASGRGLRSTLKFFVGQAPAGLARSCFTLFPQPRELPSFTLQQYDCNQLVPDELKGHWTRVFLGFTYCPDVCPTTLAELAQAQKQWEALPESTRPRVLFVSLDPECDDPDRIGEYAHAFHRDSMAATAETGRAHLTTPVTNAPLVCRLLLAKT